MTVCVSRNEQFQVITLLGKCELGFYYSHNS